MAGTSNLPFEVPEVDFTRYSNRQLAALPLAVLGVAILVIVGWYLLHGTPVAKGIEFTGGTELQVHPGTPLTKAQFQQHFDQEITSTREIRATGDYVLIFQSSNSDTIQSQAVSAFGQENVKSVQSVAASFGVESQTRAVVGVVMAFLGMSVVVFLLFRTFVPSIAVVLSAFSDIVIPIALMDVFGIKLSLGTVAALLMLIGYSVDSDILLTNHVLRRSGGFYESAYRAMRTGVTMTTTSLSAMAVMAFVAYLFGIQLLTSIGIILVFGLAADLMNTYLLNLSLLRWYKYEGVAR